jgi:16S rRNA processing protein RimM
MDSKNTANISQFESQTMSPGAPWKNVGKIKDAHSLKGELFVLIFSKDISWADELKECRIGETIFNVQRWKPYKEGLLLKAQGVEDRTQAEKLRGQVFSIPQNLLESEEGDTIYLSEIQDFRIVTPEGVELGRITGFSSNRAQDLLIVEKTSGGQAEIPFVDDFIVEIKFEEKKIEMDLPEGIWDLQNL